MASLRASCTSCTRSAQPVPAPSRRSLRCKSASFTAERFATSSGDLWPGMGPSCPWPSPSMQAYPAAPRAAEGTLWGTVQAAFGFAGAPEPHQDSQEAHLPPQVERLALFTDAPEALPDQGWASLWRYQGFK